MMWKHRFAYVILWLFTFSLYIFYVGYVSWLLFMLVCILPIFSISMLFISRYRISIKLTIEKTHYHKLEKGYLQIRTHTYTRLPIAKITGNLLVDNVFTQTQTLIPMAFGSSFGKQCTNIEYVFSECGKVQYSLQGLRIYDPLGLLSWKLKQSGQAQTYCLPIANACEFSLSTQESYHNVTYNPYKKGMDRDETFDIHSYQPGDSMHAIHWKLSAKRSDIMVREFSAPLQAQTSLCFAFYGTKLDIENILNYVYGGSLYLLQSKIPHMIKQYEKGIITVEKTIHTKQELNQCFYNILNHKAVYEDTSSMSFESFEPHKFYVFKDGIHTKGGYLHD